MKKFALANYGMEEALHRIDVYCVSDSRCLDLSDLGLERLPDELEPIYGGIHILNVSENNLTELPDLLKDSKYIESLDLSYNKFTTLPNVVSRLSTLRTLNLRGNAITQLPETIKNLSMLHTLDISRNRLTALPKNISKLALLDRLVLHDNEIAEFPQNVSRFIKPRKLNLLGHLEQILELSKLNPLNDKFMRQAKINTDYVKRKLDISPIQAVLFAHFIALYEGNAVTTHELCRSLMCSNLRIIQYSSDLRALEKKKLIRATVQQNDRYYSDSQYRIPCAVITAIEKDSEYRPPVYENLTIEALFANMEKLFELRQNDQITFAVFVHELLSLIGNNKHLLFSKKIKSLRLSKDHAVVLMYCFHLFVNNDVENTLLMNLNNLFSSKSHAQNIRRELKNRNSRLITSGVLENSFDNGFGDRESFKLTRTAKKEFLAELNIKIRNNRKDLILSKKITRKKLFYNDDVSARVNRLSALLKPDNFASVQDSLKSAGMRSGFACLFYGPPGTGKSETVYQIGRETGRDLMFVDISATKSMWFGESEKRIKEIFDTYAEYVEDSNLAPILVFNEADAVIGKRKDVTTGNIIQTENAIQNIILQELENLKGIFIATTNLTENMDKAFERRFIYKVEFAKPDVPCRRSIWKALIPGLSQTEAGELARHFSFSGGQIENIARKRTVEAVISGVTPGMDTLIQFCEEELLSKGSDKKIGFGV
jgi:SpoVK/Ycf46/Vps4 family AAA+-type ATPase